MEYIKVELTGLVEEKRLIIHPKSNRAKLSQGTRIFLKKFSLLNALRRTCSILTID